MWETALRVLPASEIRYPLPKVPSDKGPRRARGAIFHSCKHFWPFIAPPCGASHLELRVPNYRSSLRRSAPSVGVPRFELLRRFAPPVGVPQFQISLLLPAALRAFGRSASYPPFLP